MSIISWTSPSASDLILPASTVTRSASASLCSRSNSPSSRTNAPRTGAGVTRHWVNACSGRGDRRGNVVRRVRGDPGDDLTGDRRANLEVALAGKLVGRQPAKRGSGHLDDLIVRRECHSHDHAGRIFLNEAHATHSNFTKSDGRDRGRADCGAGRAAALTSSIHRPIRPALSGHFVLAKRVRPR